MQKFLVDHFHYFKQINFLLDALNLVHSGFIHVIHVYIQQIIICMHVYSIYIYMIILSNIRCFICPLTLFVSLVPC